MLAHLLTIAQHHHQAGRLTEAADACRQALALAPPPGTLQVIGQVGVQAGDWDLAAAACGCPWCRRAMPYSSNMSGSPGRAVSRALKAAAAKSQSPA